MDRQPICFAPGGDRDLSGIVLFERQGWARPQNWPRFCRDIRWMRQQQFDWIIDLQGLLRSGTIAWLANGKLLVGLDEAREGARGYYDIIVRRPSFQAHAVDWYLNTQDAQSSGKYSVRMDAGQSGGG